VDGSARYYILPCFIYRSFNITKSLIPSLQLSAGQGVHFFPYQLDSQGTCVVQDSPSMSYADVCIHPENGPTLVNKLKKVLDEVDEDNV